MVTIKVSSKGQIVIPAGLRKKYGFDQGTEIGVLEYPGELVLVPLPTDAVRAAKGMFRSKKPVREMLEKVRAEEQTRDRAMKKKRAS